MLDFPFGTKLCDHFAVEILCIIGHYLLWRTITTNQVFFYKPLHHFLCYMSIRTGFYPFCEVVNSYEDESMPIAGFWVNRSNHINPPHRKWLGRC
ncbi:hypothetical protein NC651_011804 [Populus alba x Populus x berolinensis]|nr:hypothetical protein NC651_011804 [Populus alba x Populus x berolinensis]